MSEHYNQEYTEEQIDIILKKIKECVNNDKFMVSKNEKRLENQEFIEYYRLDHKKQKELLESIEVADFCHSLNNKNPKFSHEKLYVFCPQRLLYDISGGSEMVDVYVKFNIIEIRSGRQTIVISLHKPNKPIEYAFR